MPVIGTLTVDLVANTAKFTGDLGKASGDLKVFGDSAEDAGKKIDFSMLEARGSVVLLGDQFGVHMPREISRMIATIPGVGVALEALLPILGAVFAADMIYKWVEAQHKAAETLESAWTKAADTIRDIFAKLGDRMLEVGIKADELAGDHLGALAKKLELIDHQTLNGIIGEFDRMGKDADDVFSNMQSNWFMQMLMGRADVGPAKAELAAMVAEINKLKGSGADPGNATRALLGSDIDQVSGKIKAIYEEIEANKKKMQEAGLAGAGGGDGGIAKLQQQLDLEKQNLTTLEQMKDVAAQSTTAGEGDKKYDRDVEAKRETEALEKQQKDAEKIYAAIAKAHKELSDGLEKDANEVSRINNFELEDGLRQELKAAQEKAKIYEGLAKEESSAMLASAKLKEAADEEAGRHQLAIRSASLKEATDLEIKGAADRAKIDADALDTQIARLKLFGDKYTVEIRQLEDKKKQIITASNNEIKKIQDKADEEQIESVRNANNKIAESMSDMITKTLAGHRSMVQSLEQMAGQLLQQAEAFGIKMMLLAAEGKASDAASAASTQAKNVFHSVPFPENVVLAPAAAAAAFAAVMKFEGGGEVPGMGVGDNVPAMLTPGETVVTKQLTDSVKASRSGGKEPHFHFSPTIQAIDAKGVDNMLRKHANVFNRHVKDTLRKEHK